MKSACGALCVIICALATLLGYGCQWHPVTAFEECHPLSIVVPDATFDDDAG